MAEVTLEGLFKQIETFEQTIAELSKNVATLKKKLQDNKEKYGPDMSKWPKEK